MTTSPSYFKEKWIPLDPSARSWEQVGIDQTTSLASPLTVLKEDADDDFAVEAGYSRPGRLQSEAQEDRPMISEKHFWGMVEGWGPKAGAWGKGAKVFDRKA